MKIIKYCLVTLFARGFIQVNFKASEGIKIKSKKW